MSPGKRLGALVLAAFFAAAWLYASLRGARTSAPEAPAAALAEAPPPPVRLALKGGHRRRRPPVEKPAANEEGTAADAARKKARGSRLREKGEALGGDRTQREMARDERAAEKADRDASAQ